MTSSDYLAMRPIGVTPARSGPDKSLCTNALSPEPQLNENVIVVVYVPTTAFAGGVRVRFGVMV